MSKRLYVGNLSYRVTNDDLYALFANYGAVESAEVMSDKFTGRSKGFGFVNMPDDTEATAAIEALNNKDHEGRALVVNEARPKEERSSRSRDW